MESTLSVLFLCLSGAMLLLVLLALFRSLRALLSRSASLTAGHVTGAERDALLGEKRSLLQTLRDLEFERQTGKLSDADFDKLNGRYRARARDVLRALDEQLSEYRQQAKALLAEELSKGGDGDGTDDSDASPVQSAEAAQAARPCGECATDNDADAVFCKKCGTPLQPAAAAATTGGEA